LTPDRVCVPLIKRPPMVPAITPENSVEALLMRKIWPPRFTVPLPASALTMVSPLLLMSNAPFTVTRLELEILAPPNRLGDRASVPDDTVVAPV
jgi:hypothetical protein